MSKNNNKPFAGKHILVLEGYCKQSLPFIRGFKELGCEVRVLCGTKLDCGYASRLPDHKILGVCDFNKPEESEKYIIELIKTGNYDLVVPVFEFGARILAHNKEELSKYAIICVNDKYKFDRANDKNAVMKVCMENNLPCPKTLFDIQTPQDVEKGGLAYPIIIKPRSMFGARGFHVFHNENELVSYVDEHGINLTEYVVQECIPLDSDVMAGNGELEQASELARDLGIEKQVILLGWVSGEKKDMIYKEATAFCLPSYAEGFPMAVLDAWSYGLPVITTPVGGIPDIAESGKNLLLFNPGDINKLAECLEKIITDGTLRDELAKESKRLAATTFNIDTINKQVGDLYDELSKKTNS